MYETITQLCSVIAVCMIGRIHHCSRTLSTRMSYSSHIVLVCMFSILFKPTSSGPIAEINDDVTHESDYNKKLVKNMFSIFSNIPNGFDPNEDLQLKMEHRKPSVICWTHIVTKMKNNKGDTVDQISEYAISFESPTNPDYNYVINSDPDVYGNTRTFFIAPPEIIYRNKDHIVEKNKYITCSFSSQYHKSYGKLPDGSVEIKIVKNNKKLLDNSAQEEPVPLPIPTEKPVSTIKVYPEYHQVVKKDEPVVENMPKLIHCNTHGVDKLSNDNDTPDEPIRRRMYDKSIESTNEEFSTEYLHQPTGVTTQCAEHTTTETKHIPTIIEPTNELPQINDDIKRYAEVFPLKRIELVPSDDLVYKQHVYCQNINSHITAIRCPSDFISIPLINELRLPYYVQIQYSDITPDFTDANQIVVVGQRQCYLFEIVSETECPEDNWKILTIYEPIKNEIPYPGLTEPEIKTDKDYSSAEQTTKTTIDKNYSININTPVQITEKPELHTTVKPTTDISVDSFLIRIIKSNAPKDENNIMEKCLEIDEHVSVTQCPARASLLPTINERILPSTVILNYLEHTPDIDDNKLIVRGEIFCYIFNKICEITCPADEYELFTVLEVDAVVPTTTISATTQEVFEHLQPEIVTENNDPETTTVSKPEGFILRIAEVKIDSSEEESTLKVTCRYIDNHIFELDCPSEIPDLPYFDEYLFPYHVELDHIDKLPEITDKMLILRGNINCYILNMVNTTDCPSDPTKLLTLTILDNDEVESPKSESQQLERKNSSPKPYDTNESEDESEEDCDYVSAEDERTDKIPISTTMISYQPKYFQVRLINIVSFDKVAITCYNVDKYITLLNCPKTGEKIPEFDVEKLPSDTIILDEMGKEILLNKNQMIVKGKGYCYALTKLNMEKCPIDGQRRMVNIIDCNIDSESHESFRIEPINSLENLLNPSFPVAFEVMHISQRPDIPTYISVTCENMNSNIGIVKCPTGFFRIPIVNESLLAKYPSRTYENMPELNENMVLAKGKRVCYILEKIGKIECPKDLNKMVRILTHDVIENEELRSSTEYSQNIETVIKTLDETTEEIFSTSSKPIEEELRTSTEYLENIETVSNKLYESTTERTSTSSGTTKETVFGEDENNIFPVAIKVLHIPLQSNISPNLTVTCENVNSNVAIIDCPTEVEQIPFINEQLLAKYAKQIIHKNITEFSENMLLVRGKKDCYILDQVGETECPQHLHGIVIIFTSHVIQPENVQTSTEYLQDIETTTSKLHEIATKITSTTSRPTEVEPSTLTKNLQYATNELYESTSKIPSTGRPVKDIETTTNKLHKSTAKITSTTSKSEEEEPRTSISDIETTINKLHETTTKIPSTSSRPLDEEPKTSTKYLQDTETTTNKLHETITQIPSTSSKPEKEEPRTTTEYLQDIETTTNKLHETTTKIPSNSSKPIEDGPRTTTEYLQEIETIINKLHETTTEIISTTTTKDENITFPVALEILHISPNITIPTHMTVTCENINGKITVINCPSGFQTFPTVNENLLPEYTKQEFHNNIPEINDNMLLVRGTKYCYIFDKIGKIECPADMSRIINILKYEEIEPVKPQEIETTTIVPTTPGESSEEIKLTDEETFPIAIQVEHISTQSNRPSYMAVHCENINRIINVIKCPKNFKKFPVINRKLLTQYITDIIPIKKPQLNDSMLLVRGNKGCYILHRIGKVKCPKNMNNILKIFTYTFAEYLPNIDITTHTSITENSPTSNKINYEPIQVTESIPLNDSDQDGTSIESKATTSNLKGTEASTTIDTKISSEATTVKADNENDEQNNEDNTGSTLHTTSVTEPTTTTMMDNEYNHEFVTTKSIELTTIVKDNTVASTATDIPETHQEGTTTDKSLSESSDNLAITVSITTEQTTIESNRTSLESSTMPHTNTESTETVIADETVPTSSTNAAVSTSVSDTEVTEMSQPNHELTTVKTTTETETSSPIFTETTNPIDAETTSPIDAETTSQIYAETTNSTITETTTLIDAETTSAIVTETNSPIDAETTSPINAETTSAIYVKTTSPIDAETTSPIGAETTSPTVTEITSPIDAETTSPIFTEISSPIDSETTSPTITETTTLFVTETTSPIDAETTSPIDAETTSPIVTETTSPTITETTSAIVTETTSPIDAEITSPIVTETTSQNMNDENEIDSSTEINLNTKQPSETTIFDSVTETKPIIISSTEASNLPDDVHTTTPDNIVDNSHIISEKLTTPNTDKSQLTEDYTTERYTTSRGTALWVDTSNDFIDTTSNYELTTIAETAARNSIESKITVNEHTSISDTVSTDTTLKVDENTTDTTPEKENAKDVINIPVVDTNTTDNTVTDVEKIITEYIPFTQKTVLVHQMVSSTNSPIQNETTTESLFSNTGEEENTKYTTVNGATMNNIIADLNESTTDSVDDLNREHVKPVKVQNISTLSHSTIYEDVTTEKSKNNIVESPDEANIDTEDEVDDDYDDDEPIIDDDLAEYLLKNKLHVNRRSKFSPLKKRGRKNKRFHKFKRNRIGYKSKARTVPVGQGNRGNVHYNTESYPSKEKMMGHAAAYIKIHSPNNTNVTKTQQQNYTTVIYKYSNMNHPIPVAVRVNNDDDISTRLPKQRFPVKITNVFGPELTQMVCKYVDKNIKLINISTEIANLPFMNDGLLPRDVKIEYNEKLPPITGNKNLLVRGMFYYYLLKEYNTIPCPENTNNFVPITMYYSGMKPTTPTNEITRNTNSVSKPLDIFKSAAVGKESEEQRINYNDTVINTAIARRRKLTKFNVKFTIVGVPGHDITTCGHIEENMTVVDERGRTETVSIGVISSKERLYYDPYVPFQLPKDTLAVRSNGMWYVFRGYKEFKCPEDTSIFITLTLHYNNHLRRTKSYLPQISHFPVKIINIPNPNKIQITCKLMEPTVTQINLPTTVESENVAFMNISLLPDNVIINRRELSSMTIDEKSILVQNNGMYYILREYKTIECPKNIDNFVPIILYQNDVSLPNANERNWKYALGEKERTSSAFQQPSKTQHTNIESQTATVIHETETEHDPEIFKPKLNVDDELSVIPLVQETGTQRTKKEIVPLKQQETEHHALPIVHTLNPSIPEQEVVSTTLKSYVTNYPIPEQVVLSTTPKSYVTNNPIPKSTEGPMLPTPEYLSSVVVKHNNIENKEDCYEVNNRMQVNKIPCPKDTSTIPHVINPEFMKLLCPKKLRPKLKYMTGLGILRKLNMIIHDPNKQKNVN